jgi:hypothetical protein
MSDPKHRRGDAWGPPEIIALVVVIGAFLLAGIGIALDKPGATVPAWVVALIGAIALYYYRTNGKS